MNKFIITSSIGVGKTELTSFDNALIKCKIANYNLVKVSSILPPNSKKVDDVDLPEGSILFTAYAAISTNLNGQHISAAVGVGIPKDKTKIGVIMECSDYCNKDEIEMKLKNMIVEAMISRGYEIEEILFEANDVIATNDYVTAFAAISIW